MAKDAVAKTWQLAVADGRWDSRFPDGPPVVPTPDPDPPPPAGGFTPEPGFSVSFVEGDSFADGTVIRITKLGGGFGVKANAKPMYYYDSRSGNTSSSPLSRHAFTVSGADTAVFDSEFGCNGRGSLRKDLIAAGTAGRVGSGVQIGIFSTDTDGAGDTIRIFARYRRNWSGTDAFANADIASGDREWNIKNWRWWQRDHPSNPNTLFGANQMIAYGQANSDGGSPRSAWEYADGTFYGLGIYGMRKNVWETDFYRFSQSSDPDVYDAAHEILQSDRYYFNPLRRSRTVSRPTRQVGLASIQYQFIYNKTGQQWSDWWDCFYIDDTGHAVFACDGVYAASGAAYEVFIPVAWSDTTVDCVVRNGEWASLSGKRLYVITDGEQSTAQSALLVGAFT
jgi:hypothetical protein